MESQYHRIPEDLQRRVPYEILDFRISENNEQMNLNPLEKLIATEFSACFFYQYAASLTFFYSSGNDRKHLSVNNKKDTRTFLEAYDVQLCFPSALCPKNTLPLQNLYFRHSSFEENLTSSEDESEFKRHPRFVESLMHRMLFLSTVSSSNIVHALFKTRSCN